MIRASGRKRTRHLSRALRFASSLALLFAATASLSAGGSLIRPAEHHVARRYLGLDGVPDRRERGHLRSPANAAGTNNRSRWTQVVEALTGTINSYSCETIDRLSTTFRDGVYRLNSQAPYDYRLHGAVSSRAQRVNAR